MSGSLEDLPEWLAVAVATQRREYIEWRDALINYVPPRPVDPTAPYFFSNWRHQVGMMLLARDKAAEGER